MLFVNIFTCFFFFPFGCAVEYTDGISAGKKRPPHSNECPLAQLAGVVEYTDCISAKGEGPLLNESPGYGTK